MNLVVGATGHLGSEICRLLLAKGKPVKALVRPTSDQATVEKLRGLGAILVYGDLTNRASIDAACKGVTAVFSTATAIARPTGGTLETVDLAGQLGLVDAAKAAGVRQFIYVSFSGKIDADFPLRNAKRAVEQSLKNSGMTYTILRPTFFMEVWLSPHVGFDPVAGKAQIFGTGQNKVSWISLGDVAQFAALCVDNPVAYNSTTELGGPEALSPLEVVRVFEQVGGHPIQVQQVPVEALSAQRASATDSRQQTFTSLMLAYAGGDQINMRETVNTFRVQLTSVSGFARRSMGR